MPWEGRRHSHTGASGAEGKCCLVSCRLAPIYYYCSAAIHEATTPRVRDRQNNNMPHRRIGALSLLHALDSWTLEHGVRGGRRALTRPLASYYLYCSVLQEEEIEPRPGPPLACIGSFISLQVQCLREMTADQRAR